MRPVHPPETPPPHPPPSHPERRSQEPETTHPEAACATRPTRPDASPPPPPLHLRNHSHPGSRDPKPGLRTRRGDRAAGRRISGPERISNRHCWYEPTRPTHAHPSARL